MHHQDLHGQEKGNQEKHLLSPQVGCCFAGCILSEVTSGEEYEEVHLESYGPQMVPKRLEMIRADSAFAFREGGVWPRVYPCVSKGHLWLFMFFAGLEFV